MIDIFLWIDFKNGSKNEQMTDRTVTIYCGWDDGYRIGIHHFIPGRNHNDGGICSIIGKWKIKGELWEDVNELVPNDNLIWYNETEYNLTPT